MMQCSLPDDVVRTVSHLLEDLDTPLSLSAEILLRYGEWDGLAGLIADPRSYLCSSRFAADAAAVSILKKLVELPTGIDRRAAAIEKWWQGERECYKTNERLHRYLPINRLFDDRQGAVSEFLSDVRKIILSWIGYGPNPLQEGRFGPGATFIDRGGKTTVPDKMSSDPVLTRDAIWYLPQWLNTQWGASFAHRHGEFSFVPGNRFTTVPKTALTDRSIAVEPSINVFYQLALGRELRSRLKRKGLAPSSEPFAAWDLDRAQDIHRQVACESSATREFATLDLSNASDTVARTLVELLLPHGWFSALDDLRSKKTLIDGRWVVLEKFSSMGNGFTFELETIIFAAVACIASRKSGCGLGLLGVDVFVFGDDIIVKNDVARPLKSVLEFLGFTLNKGKSYFDDEPFRESCGGDFFAGLPVRPYFLKELPNGPQDYFAFANGLRALASRLALAGKPLARRAWFSVLDRIPTRVRSCRGPKDLGDVVIHDDEERWTTRWRNGIRYLQALKPSRIRVIKFENFTPEVVLACATYGTGNRRGGVIPRDGVLSYKVGWVPWS
jgi:hypothetical protein